MLAKLLKPYKKMELTYTSYSSSTDEELDEIILPSGIQSGDLIVLYCESINTSGTPTDSTPSGFIKLNTEVNSIIISSLSFSVRTSLFYKISSGSDSSTTVTTLTGDAVNQSIAAIYRPIKSITSVSTSKFYVNYENGLTSLSESILTSDMIEPSITMRITMFTTENTTTLTPTANNFTYILNAGAEDDYYAGFSNYNTNKVQNDVSTTGGLGIAVACINVR